MLGTAIRAGEAPVASPGAGGDGGVGNMQEERADEPGTKTILADR